MTQAPDMEKLDACVIDYLMKEKGWASDDFRLEHQASNDPNTVKIVAVHADDEKGLSMGGGKSLALIVDKTSCEVVRVLRFQ